MDLVDQNHTQIQATFFNEAATKFDTVVEEGKVYAMSGGQVKIANKRFTTIPNDHCITFDEHAAIEEVRDVENKITGGGYNFTTLREVQESQQVFMIDVIGIITDV